MLTGLEKFYHENKIEGDLNGILSSYLIKKRIEAIRPYLKGKKRILDIGCGVFRWTNLLPTEVEYIGIDWEEAIIKYNQNHFHYQFFSANVETDDFSFCGGDFDLVIMLAVIEHFNRPDIVLKKLKRMLNPHGIIVLTTPYPAGNFILNFGAKIRIFTRDKHTHHNLLDYKTIKELVCASGYKIIKYERFLSGLNQLAVLIKETIHNECDF